MSLCRFALRISAVQALKGRTLVGDRVRDSQIGAIDIAADGSLRVNENHPFCDVFSDGSQTDECSLRDLTGNGLLLLCFETGIASAMTETDPETGESTIAGVAIPATDENFEATLDLLQRQITTALTDPDNAWAEIWRKLSNGVEKIEVARVASQDGGMRRAARRVLLTLDTKPDPVFGEPLAETSVWMGFKTMVDEQLPDYSGVVDRMLGVPGAEVTPGILQRSRGHTLREAQALGYAARQLGGTEQTIARPIVTDERGQD